MYLLTPVPPGQLGKGEVVLEKTCIWTCSQGHGRKGLGGIECGWRGNFDHLRAGGPESPLILQVVRRNSIYLNRRSVKTVTAERIGSPSLCLPCKLTAHMIGAGNGITWVRVSAFWLNHSFLACSWCSRYHHPSCIFCMTVRH